MEQEKIPKATHTGSLDINGVDIECYNLDNGERVLSRIGFLKALGRTGKAKGGRKYDNEFQTAIFLSASNLQPLLTEDLIENSKPIIFTDLNNNEAIGYKAEILPRVAFLYNEAYDKGLLKPNQIHVGVQSKILVKALLSVSMIALVDEATGYQYERERGELGREALKKVIYTVEALASISDNKRQFIRNLANKYGQKEIPFTDLEELDNPKDSKLEKKEAESEPTFNQRLKGLLNVPPPKKDK